jgi:Domain of unknown function (DUF4082)
MGRGALFTISLFALALAQTSTATTIAVQTNGGLENVNYGANVTIGWAFTLSSPQTVTDLGYYDGSDPGLIDPHPVGIWDGAGNLLASTTVPAGVGGTSVSGFRFVPIAPLLLGPGLFTIGGYANATSPDPFRLPVPSGATISGLSIVTSDLFTRADALSRPATQADALTAFGAFGPDFLVSAVTEIPEPGGIVTTLVGLAIVMRIGTLRRL